MYISSLKGRKKTQGTGGERENGRYANNYKIYTWGKKRLKVSLTNINKIIIGVLPVPSVPP